MNNRRHQILRATQEAAHVVSKYSTGPRTSFDIGGVVASLGIPLVYRPLKGLWGATVTVDKDTHGILVTSKLDQHVQRFTLAHELGHVLLGHKNSFDESIGYMGRFGTTSRPVEEIAADTFASEVLAARSHVLQIAKRHSWNRQAFSDTKNVYQLSLRLGISLPAACWSLVGHSVIDRGQAERVLSRSVKSIKNSIVPADLLKNPWANVWEINQADTGTQLEAGPDDIFSVHLQDSSSSGYLWELVSAPESTNIIQESFEYDENVFGANPVRKLCIEFKESGLHRLVFSHRRPWNQEEIALIDISIEDNGKERGGFSRLARATAIAAGAL